MATVIDGRESGFKSNPDYKITFEPSLLNVAECQYAKFLSLA